MRNVFLRQVNRWTPRGMFFPPCCRRPPAQRFAQRYIDCRLRPSQFVKFPTRFLNDSISIGIRPPSFSQDQASSSASWLAPHGRPDAFARGLRLTIFQIVLMCFLAAWRDREVLDSTPACHANIDSLSGFWCCARAAPSGLLSSPQF